MVPLDALSARPAPLRPDADGGLRVGSSRVTLDTLIGAFQSGCSAEEMVLKYPSLDLTEVYAVIAYYLWNRAEVDAYLAKRDEEARAVREDVERRHPSAGLREMLLARKRLAS
jgi:uncharacterized protein (DUF433 family)